MTILAIAYYSVVVFKPLAAFPDTDIVYQTSDSSHTSIGFINSDATQKQVISLEQGVVRPVWSPDGTTLYFIDPPSATVPGTLTYPGHIATWQAGHSISGCENPDWFNITSVGMIVSDNNDDLALLDQYPGPFSLINLDSCKVLRVITRPGDNLTTFAKYPSLSVDGNQILFVELTLLSSGDFENTIKLMSVETGAIVGVIAMGLDVVVSPALAPDGQWITYWGSDGIHIIKTDGSQNILLTPYPIKNPATGVVFGDGSPEPRWSPDSQWVIYHKCREPQMGCTYVADFSIYKVNVTSGDEVKIVDGGIFPYWRKQ